MSKHARALKGDIVFSETPGKLEIYEDGYIILFGNLIKGIYREIPEEHKDTRLFDYSGKLIIPGFVNSLAVSRNAEDSEKKEERVRRISEDIWQEGTARLNIISEGSLEDSYYLMDYVESLGLGAYCCHERTEGKEYSLYDLEEFAIMSANTRILVKPFIFLNEDEENIEEKLNIARLSNLKIAGRNVHRIKEKIENTGDYGRDIYKDILNIIDFSNGRGISDFLDELPENNAYCPYGEEISEDEAETLKKLLREERLGIYTGDEHSVLKALRHEQENRKIFSFKELFYMATKGSGKFFGKTGSFEEFCSFDAAVIDDAEKKGSPEKRLERFLESGNKDEVFLRYVYGMKALGK